MFCFHLRRRYRGVVRITQYFLMKVKAMRTKIAIEAKITIDVVDSLFESMHSMTRLSHKPE